MWIATKNRKFNSSIVSLVVLLMDDDAVADKKEKGLEAGI